MCWQLRGFNGSLWDKLTIATKTSNVSGFLSACCFDVFTNWGIIYCSLRKNELQCTTSKYVFDPQIIYKNHTSSWHKKIQTSKSLPFSNHHMQECTLHKPLFYQMLGTSFTFQMLFYFKFCLWNTPNTLR